MATNPIGETSLATPAISGGRISVRGQHHLFAAGEDGRPLVQWRQVENAPRRRP